MTANTVSVKIIKAQKKGKQVTIVFESDLYSDQPFAVNPFYDEGPDKDQLQAIIFDINVTEKSGEVKASIGFGNCLNHFTKGHTQLHSPLNTFFLIDKDCARDAICNKPSFNGRHQLIIDRWSHDKSFHSELQHLSSQTLKKVKEKAIGEARKNLLNAMAEYEKTITS